MRPGTFRRIYLESLLTVSTKPSGWHRRNATISWQHYGPGSDSPPPMEPFRSQTFNQLCQRSAMLSSQFYLEMGSYPPSIPSWPQNPNRSSYTRTQTCAKQYATASASSKTRSVGQPCATIYSLHGQILSESQTLPATGVVALSSAKRLAVPPMAFHLEWPPSIC
jgi:hypothetical protein